MSSYFVYVVHLILMKYLPWKLEIYPAYSLAYLTTSFLTIYANYLSLTERGKYKPGHADKG
jgi:hypothetical protein